MPRDKKPPAFQFYPADFLSDENVVLMTSAARGAYIMLLCHCWLQGSLPNDPERLQRLAGIVSSDWSEIWPMVEPCFRNNGNSRLYHPRLRSERSKQKAHRDQRSSAGKRSARVRAARKKGTHTAAEWRELVAFVGHSCVSCGTPERKCKGGLTKDHVVPLYQGGDDSIQNIQPMCQSCNSAKGPDTKDFIDRNAFNARSTLVQRKANSSSSSSFSTSPSVKSPPIVPPSETNIESDFARLWKLWPKKIHELPAKRAYLFAVDSGCPSIDELEKIVKAWAQSPGWRKESGKYVPRLDGWLDGQRWTEPLPDTPDNEDEGWYVVAK